MIYGIGTDLVQVARIEKSLLRERFFRRCFSPAEQQELAGKKAESAAACFAAKEALAKALGTGLFSFAMGEVSLLHEKSGRPRLVFSGALAERIEGLGLSAHVSVSHDGGFALCVVVLEQAG